MAYYLLQEHGDINHLEIVEAKDENKLNEKIKEFANEFLYDPDSVDMTVDVYELGNPDRAVLVSKELTLRDR